MIQVRLRYTAGQHATRWKHPQRSPDGVERVLFERTEFQPRTDIPTDFVIEVSGTPDLRKSEDQL